MHMRQVAILEKDCSHKAGVLACAETAAHKRKETGWRRAMSMTCDNLFGSRTTYKNQKSAQCGQRTTPDTALCNSLAPWKYDEGMGHAAESVRLP